MNKTLASVPHQRALVRRASPRRYSLATLRSMISAWREQTRFRWDLKRISEANPHLIDDIGLTKRQAEDEIAKLPFWQR
ncbi:DUF1127 domain-containing protein [Mesorhizobium sp. M1C.F.Ca.ET.193.01.1.1]|uniref:DUF1127 domain-containing protein n=1 Tax=unclassified Mesorhizobium TaxID=325217 RepID=UPI000FD51DA9|nr:MULTISPECIES: DUF1127 domain-containing protein [unclassified Mesorhizobium]TGT03419.1 DUF1127 domain-containing protein [bacterium M00.F.Ca.ET.177.01.1.1]RWA76877.1 MAG: DUF1127 domain-containing protein [Mesorhizobium sp.]RWC04862.1 MAG: DUF1127 domain-containing protein [Mesorhizobium sp.]RWG78968.1 MAG: DUF1127 domain-containing protein [Mesorhizobium sp.]RWG80046.1 MAG: DUF1127 domain-containing protein [Mesorhizobium sp.]